MRHLIKAGTIRGIMSVQKRQKNQKRRVKVDLNSVGSELNRIKSAQLAAKIDKVFMSNLIASGCSAGEVKLALELQKFHRGKHL